MIYSVKSNQPQFRKVDFSPGFNVVLATRTERSSAKDSRNGLGKSTLIDIIHFLLGKKPTDRLPADQLGNWSFNMTLDLGKNKVTVTRAISDSKKIVVSGGGDEFYKTLEKYESNGKFEMYPSQWTNILGSYHFGLDAENEESYTPSYSSLINYFSRRNGTRGGYTDPFKQSIKQNPYDIQINNSYLLGLGWEFARNFHILKDREKVLTQIKREARSGMLSNILGVIGELDSERIRLEERASKEEFGLKSYKPLPQYDEFVKQSNSFTEGIHAALNSKKEYELLTQAYDRNLHEEVDVDPTLVLKLYKEAEIDLPDLVKKRLEDVKEFNRLIVRNRRDFLRNEINRLQGEIIKLELQIEDYTKKRADLNSLIKSHKSQDEYEELIKLHQRTLGELENTKNRIMNMKKFDEGKRELTKDLEILVHEANLDLEAREAKRKYAILKYDEFSQSLYEVKGVLNIGFTNKGLELKVDIQRSGSSGIDNMKIFCYDLVIANIWAKKENSPGFLIHDSIMFDPVDERQKAKAMELSWEESRKNNYQYICMLNSDDVPYSEFSEEFKFNDFVRLDLTDASPEGSLLGFRF